MESINIEESNIKILLINDINYLLYDFFKNIGDSDLKIYFMNKDIKTRNFNEYIVNKITNEQLEFLKENIKFSVNCLKKINPILNNINSNLDNNLWKLCIFKDMFFNLPFTLQDVIFIPISYIESSMKKDNIIDYIFNNTDYINKNFSKTLVHEKIHLLQRYNENLWNDYITKNTKWSIIKKKIFINCSLINNNKIIYNPDTFYVDNYFFYNDDKNRYYGMMLFDSKNEIQNIWFEVVELEDKINLYPSSKSISKYEHPFEELAYIMAFELIYN
jgi:hypothetical protein